MKNDSAMRWGIERRLEFIEFLLYWEGKINRKDITEFFGVSVPQASTDLRRYQELAPENIQYNRSKKFYFAPASFKPKLITPSADQYLSQLLSNQHSPDALFYGQMPCYAMIPSFQRSVDAQILRQILQAIKEQQALEVKYQSFSQDNPSWRWITPHALGFGMKRWHCRCYCERHRDFRDFTLSRILEIRDKKRHQMNNKQDFAWHTMIDIKIGPNPALSQDQQKAIEKDYGMVNAYIKLSTKVALVDYFLFEYNLNVATVDAKQHIVLLNREHIQKIQADLKQAKIAIASA